MTTKGSSKFEAVTAVNIKIVFFRDTSQCHNQKTVAASKKLE
jgi:hypothetical protein